MAKLRLYGALKLRDDALGERLAQLHAPLVKGVDPPDRALGEDAVLVKRDQLAQRSGREGVPEQRVRGAIALKHPMRHEPFWRSLRLDLVDGLAEGQRLGLRKDIGKQHVVMPTQRVQGACERDEIARYQPRSLMDQLIEGMLPVGPRLAPVDGPRVVIHADTLEGDVFAVALHGELLEVGREALQILLVWQHGDGLRVEE